MNNYSYSQINNKKSSTSATIHIDGKLTVTLNILFREYNLYITSVDIAKKQSNSTTYPPLFQGYILSNL